MKNSDNKPTSKVFRIAVFFFVTLATIIGLAQWNSINVSANHPVLVEGNCDSPVPGTTLVAPGTCGDFDGDGRIGTAEDTDGADRIFGTLNAALGPGTGAAAGTGANHNGSILIVTSGRFAETLFIGQNIGGPGTGGVANPGNVTIEAAPGVQADLDAVLQGDPAGGNTTRQNGAGILIFYNFPNDKVVTLRNLTIRNFEQGIIAFSAARVNIDNCRIENNLKSNIHLAGNPIVVIAHSYVTAGGNRIGGPSSVPGPGNGLLVEFGSQVRVIDSVFSQNKACGIENAGGIAANVQVYKVSSFFNQGGDVCGPVTVAPDPNFASN